eukprot:9328970-Pyramimonas_sp.AAC.1
MAATETVWDGSAKARTDLVRRQSCVLAVSVTPINEQAPCPLLDKYRLRNAFPPPRTGGCCCTWNGQESSRS